MKNLNIIIVLSLFILRTTSSTSLFSQTYPFFGNEKSVTITGLTFDAMEPFISANGNYLFFNNLNDGITTKLYYATKVNDSTFTYVGELNGTNQTAQPYLDAVADMDSLGNFYWTSNRDYPANFDNLHHGTFNAGNVTNIGRLHGDFYIYSPGWILMDHGISFDGQLLYFNNAFFNGCPGPCETFIGIAQKVNDSTFATLPNSDGIMQNINDTNYVYYAPCITEDNLEFYYTRFFKGTVTPSTQVEICVAVRNNATDTFSLPSVLFSQSVANIVEAPTLTADKKIMYYHQKVSGVFRIMMRFRELPTGIADKKLLNHTIKIYPNPVNNSLTIKTDEAVRLINIYNSLGILVKKRKGDNIDLKDLPTGIYHVNIQLTDGQTVTKKIVKE